MMSFVSRGITVKNMKSISIDQITAKAAAFIQLKQKTEIHLTDVKPPAQSTPNTLVFSGTTELFKQALANGARAHILTEAVYSSEKSSFAPDLCIWTTRNIAAAMSAVLQLFDKNHEHLLKGVHQTAIIHPNAKVSKSAHIGAYTVVDAFAEIGDDTIIYPHVFVGAHCIVGARCIISSHVSIGSDGFGYYSDKTYTHHKIPQIGKVVIEDDCEFGAHCAIDRATLTETRIKRGSKFDNFCHIAHNVQIGENAMITAGFIVAGSTIIGKNLTTSGGAHILGHLTVPDNVILGPRAGVLQSIEAPGMYGGYPLESYKESVKTLLSLPHVKKLRKQISKILKHLNIEED